jgi:hypothetical protein
MALVAGLRYSGFALFGGQILKPNQDSPLNSMTVSGINLYGANEVVKYHDCLEPVCLKI